MSFATWSKQQWGCVKFSSTLVPSRKQNANSQRSLQSSGASVLREMQVIDVRFDLIN
jgi:hypothetical protein